MRKMPCVRVSGAVGGAMRGMDAALEPPGMGSRVPAAAPR